MFCLLYRVCPVCGSVCSLVCGCLYIDLRIDLFIVSDKLWDECVCVSEMSAEISFNRQDWSSLKGQDSKHSAHLMQLYTFLVLFHERGNILSSYTMILLFLVLSGSSETDFCSCCSSFKMQMLTLTRSPHLMMSVKP